MANIIKIKRSDSTNTPGSNLAKGELGYSYSSNKLFTDGKYLLNSVYFVCALIKILIGLF